MKYFQQTPKTIAPANIVDGKLILSFPKAKNPILWQMDLGNIKISALEIQTLNGEATLVLKNPKGESVTIAAFTSHNDAVENLVAISTALSKANGRIASNEAGDAPQEKKGKGHLLKTLLTAVGGVTLLILVFGFVTSLSKRVSTPQNNLASSAPAATNGAPVSADDFLKGQ